jgi:hypothetical protein
MLKKPRQQGAVLVLAAVLIAVLMGIAALAIDVGRAYSLRSEMQNAVDAAALAAAAELDTGSNARDRAMAAARNLLQHDSRFASVAALLGPEGLPDSAFTFYCLIGAKYDPAFDTIYCTDTPAPEGGNRYLATSDKEAHYVRLALDPALVADHFRLRLLLLPALNAMAIQAPSVIAENARATGGRNFYSCAVAPMAICDPFEGSGTSFKDAVPTGTGIQLRGKGSGQWTQGNFGFLLPPSGGTGAKSVAAFLADESGGGCSDPYVSTQPGAMANSTTDGINTRFDQYSSLFKNGWTKYPPAPDVVDYPGDASTLAIDNRFGRGDWDFNTYWNNAHPGLPAPNGWSNLNRPLRWQVYNWEISNGKVPNIAPAYAGRPKASHVSAGSVATRRLVTVAVLSCAAMQLQGRSGGPVRNPDGFAKMFLYRQADGPPNLAAWGEYVKWIDVGDSDYHKEVLLYE